ncbi:polyadenylate-binding protein RBP47-like isoform X1 [Actinidia eriantha]|uniref:polyadenylate-binding protein RBP47-like isoform X1 n=1 Tax=Actinidia eriantha TaxID=165200 RepID=UPI00258E43D3|nr:polyadenylate-binding protein RBP47-like isoform X1 [Actinidia eriantha]
MQSTSSSADSINHHQQQQQQQQQNQQQMWMQHYQQQWMAMQYPASAMVMQHQMMYPQQHHYMPYHHQPYQQPQQPPPPQQQQQSQPQIQGSGDENQTIWVGDLQQWMDEAYLNSCFVHTGEVSTVKVIRNKQTGQSERYGFVEFLSHAAAEKVLQSFNGTVMPNTDQIFRLNWATFSTGDRHVDNTGSDFSMFAGDLAPDVTDTVLHETFASRYPSIKGAKVVVDANTGRSKGYGFVRFSDENERSRAITEMNGMYCSSRAMRLGVATPKKQSGHQQYSSQALVLTGGYASNGAVPQSAQSDGDSSNTTIFVGGIDSDVTDEDLRQSFSQYGEVVSVKIPARKGCGFVQFANRSNAEDAMNGLNGAVIGQQKVRLSWGRSPGNKQLRMDGNNQQNGAYYGKQGYGGYGYNAPQNQDSSMYAAAGGYGAASNGYGNHQQPVS